MLAAKVFRVFKRKIGLQKKKKLFRSRNRHNLLQVTSPYPESLDVDQITAGRYSYGMIDATMYGGIDEGIQIGDFCSIALGCRFICGGEHDYTGFTTYPIETRILHSKPCEAKSKGKIILADDVWIGSNALILSGVHIGQGAIVAAGAVVVKDVPPYAIVGGNPAKVIKYRFSPEVIERLVQFDFSKLTENSIQKYRDVLTKKIATVEDAESLLHLNFE